MNILIVQQGSWAKKLGIPLVHFLKEKLPYAKFGAVVINPGAYKSVKEDSFIYDSFWNRMLMDDEIFTPHFKLEYGPIGLEQIEEDLGIDSIWKRIIYTQRTFVYTPGIKHRYAWVQQLDDETIKKIVKIHYKKTQEIFKSFSPDIIITPNYVGSFHNVLYYYAKKRGINMWRINSTKLSGHYILTDDNMHRLEHVQRRFKKNDFSENSLRFAKDYIKSFRVNFIPPDNFERTKGALHFGIRKKLKIAFQKFHNFPSHLFQLWETTYDPLNTKVFRSMENISLYLRLRNSILGYVYAKKTMSLKYYVPKEEEPYFFLPLQFQPEETIMLWSPYFNNQLEFARQIAMGLPGKYTLYVKDHPAMLGRRPPKYYKKLMGTPNVKLISPDYPNIKLFGGPLCKGVISLAGTTGFEAMVLGKPIILFADLFYEALPHCIKITDITKLTEVVRKIENIDFFSPYYETALVKFIAAIKEEAIEMPYASIWGMGKKGDLNPFFKAFLDKIIETEKTRMDAKQKA